MKKIMYVLSVALAMAACTENAPKDYVTFSGKITNQNSDSLIVRSRTFSKKIMVNPDGTFSDTLKVEAGNYNVYDGTEGTTIYLKNGFDINMTIDTKEFDESVVYTGIGAEASNYLAKKALMQEEELSNESMFNLDSAAYQLKTETIIAKFDALLKNTQNLDSTFIAQQNQQLEGFSQYLTQVYSEKMYLKTVLGKGVASPTFVDLLPVVFFVLLLSTQRQPSSVTRRSNRRLLLYRSNRHVHPSACSRSLL